MADEVLEVLDGDTPSKWEERFEVQINAFFDEAISRVPGYVDRHLKNFRRVMGRSIAPRTGVGDVLVGVRNLLSTASKNAGGPSFETTSYTHDALCRNFEREVVGAEELETLLARLFAELEDDLWGGLDTAPPESLSADPQTLRSRLARVMEYEVAHDPLLAQAIRSGVKIGVPATLGYVLLGRGTQPDKPEASATKESHRKHLRFYHRLFQGVGRGSAPGWVEAVGWASGVVGTLALGGLMEYTLNSFRDIKGRYIRQLNTARYVLLYGEDPDDPAGRGILHVVRGLERYFEKNIPQLTHDALDALDDMATPDHT